MGTIFMMTRMVHPPGPAFLEPARRGADRVELAPAAAKAPAGFGLPVAAGARPGLDALPEAGAAESRQDPTHDPKVGGDGR